MNILAKETQIQILSLLTEGCSIRAVERLTKVHRDTITRLALRVGENCEAIHDRYMVDLTCSRIELDEVWGFVRKKQSKLKGDENEEAGDQYLFAGMDSGSKAIVSYTVGKRTVRTTQAFVQDLRNRMIRRPVIHSDGFKAYQQAIREAFGSDIGYGVVEKKYYAATGKHGKAYEHGVAVAVEKNVISGDPGYISTNGIERANLTLRMQSRRFTRRTNGFSKTLRHHYAAVALYMAYYNFCRPHKSLGGMTPAMVLGKTHHQWTMADLM